MYIHSSFTIRRDMSSCIPIASSVSKRRTTMGCRAENRALACLAASRRTIPTELCRTIKRHKNTTERKLSSLDFQRKSKHFICLFYYLKALLWLCLYIWTQVLLSLEKTVHKIRTAPWLEPVSDPLTPELTPLWPLVWPLLPIDMHRTILFIYAKHYPFS